MNASDLQLMFGFNDWANNKILAAAATLSEQKYFAVTDHALGSIHSTLFHHLNSEYYWRMVLQFAPEIPSDLDAARFSTFTLLRAKYAEEAALRAAFLYTLSDKDAESSVHFRFEADGPSIAMPRWHILWHVLNHGNQHRAEAAHMLTQHGASPGDLDVMFFL